MRGHGPGQVGVNEIRHPNLARQRLAMKRLAVLGDQLELRDVAQDFERSGAMRASDKSGRQRRLQQETSCRTVKQHQAEKQRQINHRREQHMPRLLTRTIPADAQPVIQKRQAQRDRAI